MKHSKQVLLDTLRELIKALKKHIEDDPKLIKQVDKIAKLISELEGK